MAKQTGIPARLFVGTYDISGDTGSIDGINSSRQLLDVTGIDKDYFERLPGLGDGEINFTAFHDPTSSHAVFSPIGTAAKIATAALGTGIGDAGASLSGAQATYATNRQAGGALEHTVQLQSFAGYGVEWGVMLANKTTASGTATVTVDGGAASTAGASAYLHVIGNPTGTVTVICQDSPDNSSFSNIAGMSFTATSAGTAERVASSGTAIARYLRYNITGGTAVIAVNFVRK